MTVDIYISVSHKGNPRGAGTGEAVIEFIDAKGQTHTRQAHAELENDTKNAITLKIITAALKMLIKPCEVRLHVDNEYIESCVKKGWLEKWQQAGWKKPNNKEPANVDLWKGLYISMSIHNLVFMPYEDRQEWRKEN